MTDETKTQDTQPAAKALPKLTISDKGQICYQPLDSNPLPGDAVAKLVKGADLFSPKFERIDTSPLSQEQIDEALQAHLATVLNIFKCLIQQDPEPPVAEPVQAVCQAVYDAAGMLPRENVQALLKDLDADMRTQLRGKGVRLGPLFIYCPEMNKPAALRVRAVLWALFNDMPLPVTRIADGVVSKRVEGEGIENPADEQQKDLYKALCYPVYGGRAIRVDMLDRVVNAVYESADKGKFQAQHAMAEWMGCSIPDLYAVLEALGHKKVYDPADEAEKDKAETQEADGATKSDETTGGETEVTPTEGEAASEPQKVANVKPELATFTLKRGQAHKSGSGRPNKAKAAGKDDQKKKAFKKGKKKQDKRNQGPRVISSGPDKPDLANSPFAVLGQLKK